jgi:hypothetical protein
VFDIVQRLKINLVKAPTTLKKKDVDVGIAGPAGAASSQFRAFPAQKPGVCT